MSKQEKRETLLALVDAQLAKVKQAQADIKMLVAQIDGEWVIRKRYTRDVSWHGGSISNGFVRYYAVPGAMSRVGAAFHSPDPMAGYVKTSKSPRDMMFIAECLAGSDRKYETQDQYVIEVVDRLDGEVFQTITKPWRHSP